MSATSPDTQLIVVIDDTELSRYKKSHPLRRAGFEVAEATNGEDGLLLVQERLPRLVVCDVLMPGIDGWEVTRRLKANPRTSSIPVLQVSATYVREEDTVRALEGGADACLTEPLEAPVLVATVRALLRTRRAEEQLREVLEKEQTARASAESANRVKDEFLATLSHELRSPLSAILTWVTLLRAGSVDEQVVARALDAIERNARLQVKLIEDLLDVSRIISGKMSLDVELVDLGLVVELARDAIATAAAAKDIQVRAVVDPGVRSVSGDAMRLQQVVWNLLLNAVKFTSQGGRVELHVAEHGAQVQIRVTDSGSGIDPAFLPHIFERFRQADSSSTRAQGGLGLGLAIVRHLVELHGGTVEAHSEGIGHGSTFIVRLPLPTVGGSVPQIEGRRVRPAVALPPDALHGVRVVVIDDDPDAREAITAVLQGSGAKVAAVVSVQEALHELAARKADVIVSDIAMPGEDGYSLIHRVRKLPSDAGGAIPSLALTAYASAEERQRILAAGFDDYLAKPVEALALIAAVSALASRRERR